MNKQEFQQKIKDMRPPKFFTAISLGEAFEAGFKEARVNVLLASDFLDEPEKPVVPQFVADWYEEHKDNFEHSVQCLCVHGCEPVRQIDTWFGSDNTRPIETLVKMKLFGYEIEKEKLYTVKIPIANSPLGYHYVLRKTTPGEIIIDSFFTDNWGNYDYCQLTEEEIKKDHGWAWKYAEEVK